MFGELIYRNHSSLQFMSSVLECNSPYEWQFTTNIPLTGSSEAEEERQNEAITHKLTYFKLAHLLSANSFAF